MGWFCPLDLIAYDRWICGGWVGSPAAGERGGDLAGPGPAGRDASVAAALPAGQPSCAVRYAVAQPLGFGVGQLAVQGGQLSPGGAVDGDRGEAAPGSVDGELARWQPAKARCLTCADAVRNAGMGAAAGC